MQIWPNAPWTGKIGDGHRVDGGFSGPKTWISGKEGLSITVPGTGSSQCPTQPQVEATSVISINVPWYPLDMTLFNSLEINPLQELGPVILTKTFHPTKLSNKSTRRKASSTLYTLFFDVFWIPSFTWCSSRLHALKLPSAILGTVDVVNPCSTQRSSTGIIPGHRRENFQQFLSTWTMAGMTVEWQLAAKDVFLEPKSPAHLSSIQTRQCQCLVYLMHIHTVYSFAFPLSGKHQEKSVLRPCNPWQGIYWC